MPEHVLPRVERPSFHIWQPLVAESILWEGQVLIVGGSADMPALLVMTSQRLALIANGQIMLDFPRGWLRPAPQLAAENGVRLFINPEGATGNPQPILLRARDGRGDAMALVSVLTGRAIPGTAPDTGIRIPNWKETVGASRAVALPNLSESHGDSGSPRMKSFWPLQESDGVMIAPSRPTPANPRPADDHRPMQTLADRRRAMPEPAPVPAAVSREARKQGTQADGVTVRDDSTWQGAHVPANSARRRGISTWLVTAALFALIFGGIGYVVQDRYNLTFNDLRDRIPQNVQESLGFARDEETDPEVAINTAPETVSQSGDGGESDGTDDSDTTAEEPQSGGLAEGASGEPTEEPTPERVIGSGDNQINNGLGGTTADLPETAPAQDPTAPIETIAATEAVADPTQEPTAEPTTEPTPEPTVEPTEEPTQEPTVEPTSEPTLEPTQEPTEEPTVEPTSEPTIEPTEEPTTEPTPEPTTDPTVKATETPEATEEPAELPEQLPTQEPSVQPETTPEQAVVANGFRYTVEGASVGESVPELPEINSVAGYGQWVVLNVYGQNMSGDVQVFDMSKFVLIADGEEIPLDSGTAWVNGLVGNTPAYGPTDAIQWAPGESHSVTLTFLAPAGAESLVLRAGDQQIDLAPALQDPAPLMSEGPRVESDLVQGTVVDVIDGETIVVEIDGVQQTVRYLGLDVPTGDACYASEAAAANRSLVEGQTVTIERQATDVDARGNWVRDVWVTDSNGQMVLASQQLIAQGAAEANISQPNTRFAGWLQQTQATAQADGAGIWGSCGE
jgi:endonuclease YncB( thermonuclease family)